MIPDVEHLVGAAEIGKMFGGISRQRVHQITSRADFPEPEATLMMGKVWRTDDVREWAAKHGREIHEDDETRSPGEAGSGPVDH